MNFGENDIKPQNLQQHCRTCLSQLDEQKHPVNNMAPSLLQILQQCTDYRSTQDRIYPACICGQCYEKLEIIEAFQIMSKESMKFLHQLAKSYKTMSSAKNAKELHETVYSFDKPPDRQNLLNEDHLEEITKTQDVGVKQEYEETAESFSLELPNKQDVIVKQEYEISTESFSHDHDESIQDTARTTRETSQPADDKLIAKHTCPVCFKRYATASSLRMHKRLHLAERPFKCEKCERGFNKRYELNNHVKKYHNSYFIILPSEAIGNDLKRE